MSVKQAIDAIVAPLWKEHEQLAKARSELREKLEEIDEQVRQLEKVLRAADPASFVKEPSQNGNISGRAISQKSIDAVHRVMWAESHVTHTIPELARKMGISTATADSAITELRARGVVRATGRMPNPHGRGAVMGFRIGEQVPPPVEEEPKKDNALRTKVSPERVATLLEEARTLPQPFTRQDLKRITKLSSPSGVDFGIRILVLNKAVEELTPTRGINPATYRVTDGS